MIIGINGCFSSHLTGAAIDAIGLVQASLRRITSRDPPNFGFSKIHQESTTRTSIRPTDNNEIKATTTGSLDNLHPVLQAALSHQVCLTKSEASEPWTPYSGIIWLTDLHEAPRRPLDAHSIHGL